MEPSAELHDVSVTLGAVKALRTVRMTIPKGVIVGFLGPSGAGKTTLMRVLAGRQNVQHGKAIVLGQPAGSARLRGHIGYMPQSPAVYQDLTVLENLAYFAAMIGTDKKQIDNLIHQVDLVAQKRQLAGKLSGGQKARLSLAIALLGKPELLILDEPTVGVDPVLRRKLWAIFRSIAAAGTTLYISSHVMDEAEHCDHLLLIRRGKILAQGSARELMERTHTNTIEESFLALVGAAHASA